MIPFPWPQDGAWETVLIRRIREVDGLQKHSCELAERTVFAIRIFFRIEAPARICEQGRLCRPGLQPPA